MESTKRENYGQFLNIELARRCRRNPLYTLRVFAEKLQVDASLLSKVLRGKRSCSDTFIQKTGKALNLGPSQIERFISQEKGLEEISPKELEMAMEDYYELISDWSHFALLELFELRDMRHNPSWMAKKLGLSREKVEGLLARLLRLKMIERSFTGEYIDTSQKLGPIRPLAWSNSAFRKQKLNLLNKSVQILEDYPIDIQEQNALIMAVDSDKLKEAKRIIGEFKQSMNKLLSSSSKKDQVYYFGVNLFPLTHK